MRVISCDIPEVCMDVMVEPECLDYYPNESSPLFSTPGKDCGDIFRNDYDMADPWPQNCQVYKTSNACS